MRRLLGMISILIMVSLACQTLLPTASPTPLPTATSTFTPSPAPTHTHTPTPSTSPTPLPSTTPTTLLAHPNTKTFVVQYHPDDALYVGNIVSLEIIPLQDVLVPDTQLTILVDTPVKMQMGPVTFDMWGIAGREQATLIWAWDTSEYLPGEYTINFSVQPQAIEWTETLTLLPAEFLPIVLAQAEWATLQTSCCEIHYITQTAAERDLPALSASLEQISQEVASQLKTSLDEQVKITLLPRLLGHGGFASDEIHVSYLDRNYAANDWSQVVRHELIHMLDHRLGGDLRPTLLVEGLAVYLGGGHYKPEPLMTRAAVLLENQLGWYLPLTPLADDFYASQHEIGYLEAGALVEYMLEIFGWEAFSAFYRDIHPAASGKQSDAITAALFTHFGISFSQLEQNFLNALQTLPLSPEWAADVRITVTLFDTLRRYQQMLDPSAYFRTAWLLDSQQMRQQGITADFLRHPNSADNLALEAMLISAGDDLKLPPYQQADQLLSAVNTVLDAIEQGDLHPFSTNPLASDYYAIVQVIIEAGHDPQKINLYKLSANVQVGSGNSTLQSLALQKVAGKWIILQ